MPSTSPSDEQVVVTFRTTRSMLDRIDREKKVRETRSEWIRRTIERMLVEGENQ